jgi:predicted RNA binding protein YcfA (HicA-like mRNA interferase family)
MPPVPAVRGSQVVKALEKAGFTVGRVNGSHHILMADG